MPDRTGRGIRIAVVDTGVHPSHPHIGGIDRSVGRSVAFDASGAAHDDAADRVGHGTAVAAAIHEKAPDAALLAVRIFDRGLVTTGAALVAAIRWSIDAGADLINLSLGMDARTAGLKTRGSIEELVADATARRVLILAAAPTAEHVWLPGALAGVIGVELDWTCARDECVVYRRDDGSIRVRASGFPRPIPGVDPEKNLKGQSFAVANTTGLIALAFEGTGERNLLGG